MFLRQQESAASSVRSIPLYKLTSDQAVVGPEGEFATWRLWDNRVTSAEYPTNVDVDSPLLFIHLGS